MWNVNRREQPREPLRHAANSAALIGWVTGLAVRREWSNDCVTEMQMKDWAGHCVTFVNMLAGGPPLVECPRLLDIFAALYTIRNLRTPRAQLTSLYIYTWQFYLTPPPTKQSCTGLRRFGKHSLLYNWHNAHETSRTESNKLRAYSYIPTRYVTKVTASFTASNGISRPAHCNGQASVQNAPIIL